MQILSEEEDGIYTTKAGVRIMLPQDNVIDSLSILETYIKENRLIEKGHKKIDLRVSGKITTDRVNSND